MFAAFKRLVDIVVSLVGIVVLAPLFVAIAYGVWRSDPGPFLFAQNRVGRHGQVFRFLKFRSMYMHDEEYLTSILDTQPAARDHWDRYQKLRDDPRITPFGRFLRKSSLDELPQLFNILVGDMSLVGPRPVTPAERGRYGPYWDSYCKVKPGLTGLWQVSGRSNVAYAERVRLDHTYVTNWSLWLDLVILVKTVPVVFARAGSY